MAAKKTKKLKVGGGSATKAIGGGLGAVAAKIGGGLKGVVKGKKTTAGVKRRRITPEKLMRKILILKLKKKLYKLQYGGR